MTKICVSKLYTERFIYVFFCFVFIYFVAFYALFQGRMSMFSLSKMEHLLNFHVDFVDFCITVATERKTKRKSDQEHTDYYTHSFVSESYNCWILYLSLFLRSMRVRHINFRKSGFVFRNNLIIPIGTVKSVSCDRKEHEMPHIDVYNTYFVFVLDL